MRLYPIFSVLMLALNSHAAGTLTFEANQGQTRDDIRYLARCGGGIILFTDSAVVLPTTGTATGFEFVNQGDGASWSAADPTGDVTNYIVGRDPAKWANNVAHYRRLVRHEVWPGIDVAFYGNGDRLEYDFLLAPHANASRIRLRFTGVQALHIDADGTLRVDTAAGVVRHQKPVLYETAQDGTRRPVSGSYRLTGSNEVGFAIDHHDPTMALAIDPVLESSSYFGGNADEKIVAAFGDILIGTSNSIDIPGAAFARRKGGNLFYRTRNSNSSNPVYFTTIIGGAGDTQVTSAAISNNFQFGGLLTIGGYTNAPDLPTVSGVGLFFNQVPPFQKDYAGGASDGFFLVLNSSNQSNGFLTYAGTAGEDRVTAVSTAGTNTFAAVGWTNGDDLGRFVNTTYVSPQPTRAGGIDGFLMAGFLTVIGANLYGVTYIGGSGDDTPASVLIPLSNGYYVAGETTSSDFPLVNGYSSTRSGGSDAFLMKFAFNMSLTASTLFGGSGADRAAQMAAGPNGGILVAGTTSSTDLPLVNPQQSAYGGGDSDAFIAQFSPDLSLLTASTYMGGSGADEGTSAGVDSYGNIFAAGWTSSRDFPVVNALQPQFGGGADDGFVVEIDTAGAVHQTTYFGGSGSDRILFLQAGLGGDTVTVAGVTSSANLPLKDPDQDTLKGATDGFVARISDTTFSVGPLVGGKNMRAGASFMGGNSAALKSATVTITSSDPSTVQLAPNPDDPGSSALSLAPNAGRYFYYDCLTESGGADLTLSSPGYSDKIAHVTCVRPQIVVAASATVTTRLFASPTRIAPYFFARDPNNPAIFAYYLSVIPGQSPIPFTVTTSNPDVGKLSADTLPLKGGSSGFQGIDFTPTAMGTTELAFSAPGAAISPADRITISVLPPVYSTTSFTVPGGFQTRIFLAVASFYLRTSPVTVTSQDPSKLLLSLDAAQPGTASITLPGAGTIFAAQALATSGDATLTVAAEGQDPFTILVHLTSPVARLFLNTSSASPVPLTVGQGASFSVGIGNPDPLGSGFYAPNPSTGTLNFTVTSSNPGVLTQSSFTGQIKPVNSSSSFQVTGAADGSTTLNLQPLDGIPLAASRSFGVVVKSRPLTMSDVDLGNNLAGQMQIGFPTATAATNITLTSSNPALVLVSKDAQSAGQAQITITAGAGAGSATFFVYGMAASGQVKITADIAGVGSTSANVQLDPSGFGWTSEGIGATLYQFFSGVPGIVAFAIDSATMLPVAQQVLRPGVTATVTLTNSNPDVISMASTSVSVPLGVGSLRLTANKSGSTAIGIVQPAGFSAPAVRQQMTVKVSVPSLNPQTVTLGKYLQVPVSVQNLPNLDLPLTVTSSDPSKLVLSSDPNAPGGASVTVPRSGWNSVYAQGMDTGPVTLTYSMPTFADSMLPVAVQQTGIGLAVDQNPSYPLGPGSVFANGKYTTTTQSPKTRILPQVYVGQSSGAQYTASFRPGVGPIQVDIVSSRPEVGTINGSPVRVAIGQSTAASVDFVPAGTGETEVSVSQPPGFAALLTNTKVVFTVSQPGFATLNMVYGKDTMVPEGVGLPNNVTPPTVNVPVTITSPDPANILLSTDPDSPPKASITVPLVAGKNGIAFYVHALGNTGIYPLKLSAPGFADSVLNAALADLAFGFDSSNYTTTNIVLQNGPRTVRVAPAVISPPGLTNYGVHGGPTLRPGIGNVTITAVSSDPNVIAIDNPQLVFQPGTTSATLTYRPVSGGSANLMLSLPPGFVQAPVNTNSFSLQSQLSFTVSVAKLNVSTPTIGRDLQQNMSVGSDGSIKPQTQITVSSSDPSRLLLAADERTPGQGSITITSTGFYAQALSDSGTVNVTVSADGYQSGSGTVTLAPSAAVFTNINSSNQLNLYTNSGTQHLSVALSQLDPATLQPRTTQTPRPGASLTVPVNSSDTKVLSVSTPSLQFTNQPNQPVADIKPVAIGTAILSLGLLPGGISPASGRQMVVNIAEPNMLLPDFVIGRDLAAPMQVTLGNSVPSPTADLSVYLQPSNVLLSNSATDFGTFGMSVTIPAGQRASRTFYVQGNFTGAATIQYGGGGYNSAQPAAGTVTGTAFIFREAAQGQSVRVTAGGTGSLTVQPALSPLGTQGLSPLSIRGGISPITITVTSSDSKVLTVTTPQITLRPGDQQVTVPVRGVAQGTATLTLSGATYDFATTQSSIKVTVN